MNGDRQEKRYDLGIRSLHWLTVILLASQFVIAWTMPDIHHDTSPKNLIAWHLAIGLNILVVVILRAGWRLSHREPPPPSSLPPVLQFVSRATHVALYGLLLAVPLLGWVNASSRGWQVELFGAIPLPSLMGPGSATGRSLGELHQLVAIVLLVVVGLHILGALYHGLILRDGTVRRML